MATKREPKRESSAPFDDPGGLSSVASANAPFIYFEAAPAFGHLNGIVRVTLTAARIVPTLGEQVHTDHVIVGHLRMNMHAAVSLRDALNGALLLASQPETENPERPN